jgi:hypothetical protein
VVSAISPRPNPHGLRAPSLGEHVRPHRGLCVAGVKRVLYVGGASSLEVARGKALADLSDFPEMYRAEAREGRESLAVWRNEAEGLDWTYRSPAAEIGPGERTGKYRTTGDQLLVDAAGKSFTSFEDYAVALLDEMERAAHRQAVRGRVLTPCSLAYLPAMPRRHPRALSRTEGHYLSEHRYGERGVRAGQSGVRAGRRALVGGPVRLDGSGTGRRGRPRAVR